MEIIERHRKEIKESMKQKKIEEERKAELVYQKRIVDAIRISVCLYKQLYEEAKLSEKEKSWEQRFIYNKREQEKLKKYGTYMEQLNHEFRQVKNELKQYENKMNKCNIEFNI